MGKYRKAEIQEGKGRGKKGERKTEGRREEYTSHQQFLDPPLQSPTTCQGTRQVS